METLLSPVRVTCPGTRTLRHFITGISLHSQDFTPFLDMTLCPFVQPIINTLTGKVAGIEVLLRLRDKAGRYHSPEPIIEMLESTSEMNDITAALITEISYNLQPVALEMPANFFVTFNISAIQISDGRLKCAVRHFVEVLSPRIPIYLEIVERSSGEELEAVSGEIKALMSEGVHFAIDDFGGGSSTLKLIETLKFSLVKIDKSLADAARGQLTYKHTLAAMVSLAQNLNIKLVVEGVETEQQANLLQKSGVQLLQGYYYARPVHISQFLLQFLQ